MASYVVAAALFIMTTSYLIQFVVEPPGSSTTGLEHVALKSQGERALEVLLGTPGVPRAWGASSTTIDGAERLGLLEGGSSIRINTTKFDALARGKYTTTSNANGAIDYGEAKAMLGLDGYDFHIRAYPAVERAVEVGFGVEDMEDFDIAYIGHIEEGSLSATGDIEADSLAALDVAFTKALRDDNVLGDVFEDDSVALRDDLLPSLGATIQEEVISNGAGTKYDFIRLEPTVFDQFLTLEDPDDLTEAMTLSTADAVMGYSKNRELRAILGGANLSDTTGAGTLATISWSEWVDTDKGNGTRDCGDYGWVEVSGDGGATWVRLTDTVADRSQDCGVLYAQTPSLTTRTATITGTACAACEDNEEVLVAFHWLADNDNNMGYGWVVDDVLVVDGDDNTLLRKTFATPEYDMLIVGSDVTHNAFTPEEVKAGLRDYVDLYGGRLIVLGGQSNVQWLDRLFDAAVGGAAGGVAAPDNTHPILTLPNELTYTGYVSATPWDFSASDDAGLFTTITGSDEDHAYLAVSRQGAWGSGEASEGAVILTSYKPGEWADQEEASRFFANALLYGRYHYLYLEVGPPVPDSEDVASVTRSATMNKYREGYDPEYVEMAFVMYVWPGGSAEATLAETSVNSMEPRDVTAEATDERVWVNWTTPLSVGSADPLEYLVYRGNGPTTITTLVHTEEVEDPEEETYSWLDTDVTNGVSYWYHVKLITTDGSDEFEGVASDPAAATPVSLPSEPLDVETTNGLTTVQVDWTMPAWTGPGPIYGYAVWARAASELEYELVAEIGNVTTYTHSPSDGDQYYYEIAAINARGYGPFSDAGGPGEVLAPAGQPTLTVTNVTAHAATLAWTVPELGGSDVQHYIIDRSDDGVAWARLAQTELDVNVSFVDEEVEDNTTYHYRVAAVTAFGDGAWSEQGSTQTMGTPWTIGALTKTASVNGVSMTFSWDVPNDAGAAITGYEIYRGADANTMASLGTALTNSYTDLTAGSNSYYYKVRGVNAVGNGAFSDAQQMPMTASAPTMSILNTTAGRLIVSWTPPADLGLYALDGYRFERSDDGGSTYEQLPDDETLLANLTWSDLTVTANATYTYRVAAVTEAGEGSADTESKQVLSVPWTVTGLARSGGVNGVSTSLSWNAANTGGSAILSYEVFRSDDNSSWSSLGTSLTTSYTDLAQQASAPYYYKVRATNALGDGDNSTAIYAANAPGAPTLTVTNGTAGRLDLSWTTPSSGGSSITGYKIYRSTDGNSWSLLVSTGQTNTTWNDATTSANTTYYYRVAGVNAIGDGTNSSDVSKKTLGAPWPPSISMSYNALTRLVTITWSAPNNGGSAITAYEIWRGTSSGSETVYDTTLVFSPWTETITNNKDYYYKVRAVNAVGNSDLSNEVEAHS